MDDSEFLYSAFISYRHIPRDMEIARKLHSALETYRVPGNLVKKGFAPRISRVFRDREELPTSSDLSSDIEEALKRSRYLIVICSPEAVTSEWVVKEVEFFARYHGYEKILTLLVDGEPKDSFPPGIIRYLYDEDGKIEKVIEPLAADIRKKDGKSSVTLLKEEKLRLIATMIGCKYDDLRQREHERKIRKIITASVTVGAVLAIFALVFLVQLYQVTAARNLAQKNKSSLLTYVAMSLTNNGDRISGMLLALEAYESNGVKNTAFNVEAALYNSSMNRDFQNRTVIKNKEKIHKGSLNADENYLLVETGLSNVKIYDATSGELLETFSARKYYDGFVKNIIPYSNNIIIEVMDQKSERNHYVLYDVINKKELCVLKGDDREKCTFFGYDLETEDRLTSLPLFCYSVYDISDKSAESKEVFLANTSTGAPVNSIVVPFDAYCTVIDENSVAVTNGSNLTIYNINTGKPVLAKSFQNAEIDSVGPSKGKYLAIRTDKKELTVLDITNGKPLFSLSGVELYNAAFDNKFEKAAIMYSDMKSTMKLAVYTLKDGTKACETQTAFNSCSSLLFTPDNSKIIAGGKSSFVSTIGQFNSENAFSISNIRVLPLISFQITKDGVGLIALYSDNTIGIIEMTANELFNVKYNGLGSIKRISPDKTGLLGTLGFDICVIDVNSGKVSKTLRGHTDYVNFFDFSCDGKKIISSSYDGTTRIWDTSTGRQLLSISTDAYAYSAKLSKDNKFVVTVSKDSLSVWDAATGLLLRELEGKVDGSTADADDINHFDDYAEFSPDGTKIISKRGDEVKLWDSKTGQVLFNNHIDIIQGKAIFQVMFSPDGAEFLVCKSAEIQIYDSVNLTSTWMMNFDSVYSSGSLVFSEDGKRVAFSTASATTYLWEIEHTDYISTKLLGTVYGSGRNTSLAFLPDSKRIFIMNNNGLSLFDIEKDAFLCQTGTGYNPDVKMQPAVFLLKDNKVLAIEDFGIIIILREWPVFNTIDEIVSYIKTKVGNRKIDEDFYSELSENSYEMK